MRASLQSFRFVAVLGAASLALHASNAVAAQQQFTVPPAAALAPNVPGIGEFAGASITLRQQFLVGPSHLAPLQTKEVVELWFRRDGAHPDALQGGAVDLEVRVSETAAPPTSAEPVFSSNYGSTPALVYSGRVTIPASPALGSPAGPWAVQNTIRIPLTQSFVYSGQTLCIDLIGRAVSGSTSTFWPVDYLTSVQGRGTSQALGTSCSRFANGGITAYAAPATLIAGSTALFNASGNPMTPGTFMLSAVHYPGGLDLAVVGAPGCRLHVGSGITLGVLYGPSVDKLGRAPGFATVHLQLPANPALMGASVYAQWAVLELPLPAHQWSNPLGISLSNGTKATISSTPNTLDLATITSPVFDLNGPVPQRGFVDCGKGPVLRFLHK